MVFFARLVNDHKSFETQRNLLDLHLFIDGGGAIAANHKRTVFVFLHAWADGKSEKDGRVYVVQSDDGGQTFQPARAIDEPGIGTCACCSMKAVFDERGQLHVMYRAAKGGTSRDTMLLSSFDDGRSFQSRPIQVWKGNSCPMTMFSFGTSSNETLAAWESPGTVNICSLINTERFRKVEVGRLSKYPALAVSEHGEVLLSWIEKEAWNKLGEVRWQTFDAKGKASSKVMARKSRDVWGYTCALPQAGDKFLLFY